MNTFTLLTFMGGLGVVISFFSGDRAMAHMGKVGHRCSAEVTMWRFVFDTSVFLTILAALLSL